MKLHPLHPQRWKALANEIAIWKNADGSETRYRMFTIEAGQLAVNSGRLVPCDPFSTLLWYENSELKIAPGHYRTVVTVADISDELDGSDCRDAYLSLILSDLPSVGWRFLAPLPPGIEMPDDLGDHQFIGVDSTEGAVAFVDADAVERLMPDPAKEDWEDWIFANGEPDSWLAQLENDSNVAAGMANIELPGAAAGENIVICGAGFGEGSYPVVATYAADDTLTGIHFDLMVLPLAPLPEWD